MVTAAPQRKEPKIKPVHGISHARKAENLATEHILNAIDSDGFDCPEPITDAEKAAFSYARFMSEYGWRVKQVGEFKAVQDWLQGLALNIAFYNCDILQLAREWGSLPENATESQEDKILANYWPYMAMRLIGLWNKHKVRKV